VGPNNKENTGAYFESQVASLYQDQEEEREPEEDKDTDDE